MANRLGIQEGVDRVPKSKYSGKKRPGVDENDRFLTGWISWR